MEIDLSLWMTSSANRLPCRALLRCLTAGLFSCMLEEILGQRSAAALARAQVVMTIGVAILGPDRLTE